MILYLDTSALVKRYLVEMGTEEVAQWVNQARPASTSLITRPEMAAALTKAARMKWISAEQSQYAIKLFRSDWAKLGRLPIHEATVERADELACRHGLRGCDAIHLACALMYRQDLGEPVYFATYDRSLWQAAQSEGLVVLPVTLSQ